MCIRYVRYTYSDDILIVIYNNYCSGLHNILIVHVVSSSVWEYSSNVPDGLRVTLDCPMRRSWG